MSRKIAPVFLLSLLIMVMLNACQSKHDLQLSMNYSIKNAWEFHQVSDSIWYPATVPGCVHTDLLDNDLIPDPFKSDHEKDLQWIENEDWEYRVEFEVHENLFRKDQIELIFKGLDTYADVYINEKKCLSAHNMFREWRVEAKKLLKPGVNTLRVYFHSPITYLQEKYDQMNYHLPASNDQAEEKLSILTRKAPYHFGWDWGPRFVTSGIWKNIEINAWSYARFENVFIRQKHLDDHLAGLEAECEVFSDAEGEGELILYLGRKHEMIVDSIVHLEPGMNRFVIPFSIDEPRLWWPNGMGKASMYQVQVKFRTRQHAQYRKTEIGLRNIELIREKDDLGESFYFKINGKPMFAKGANYIPNDNFLNRVSYEDYRKVIWASRDANMNMLRVWGGGIYEKDEFYRLCDQNGMLVWQDFMFACSMYPGDPEFLENVKIEAVQNVKRLRNHPCIALWCGNNENGDAWFNWGWQSRFTKDQREVISKAYKDLFHNLLPEVVSDYDPDRAYWPSSPASGPDYGQTSNLQSGDYHYWGVWHGKEEFEKYKEIIPRFSSEYGFQSFPGMKTIEYFAEEKDYSIDSEVMRAHQKNGRGNELIMAYMDKYYRSPKDFQSLIYVGQVMQAMGIRTGMEALRRSRPQCMGSLYWQLNDCWPVASWSGRDYFGRWKALHYHAKKAYENILVSPDISNDEANIYLINDLMDSLSGELAWKIRNFEGDVLRSDSLSVCIDPLSSKKLISLTVGELLEGLDPKSHVLECLFLDGRKLKSRNLAYFVLPRDLDLPQPEIHISAKRMGNRFELSLKTNKLAKDVYLFNPLVDGFFSDNYFDLLPGRTKRVMFSYKKGVDNMEESFQALSLVNTYKY